MVPKNQHKLTNSISPLHQFRTIGSSTILVKAQLHFRLNRVSNLTTYGFPFLLVVQSKCTSQFIASILENVLQKSEESSHIRVLQSQSHIRVMQSQKSHIRVLKSHIRAKEITRLFYPSLMVIRLD